MKLMPFCLYLLSLYGNTKGEIPSNQLYDNVVVGDYENAAQMSIVLDKSNGSVISDAVNKLIDNNVDNVVEFAYTLSFYGGKEIIVNHFPVQFRLILSGVLFKIVNRKFDVALKLSPTEVEGNRRAWGGGHDGVTEGIQWSMIPIWEDKRVYFKIVNMHSHFLMLESDGNAGGQHTAWGSTDGGTERHQWYLRPVKYEDDLLFYIYNRHYNELLKLEGEPNSFGDREVLGHKSNATRPENDGWQFLAIYH